MGITIDARIQCFCSTKNGKINKRHDHRHFVYVLSARELQTVNLQRSTA
jgi:hypothetical protein